MKESWGFGVLVSYAGTVWRVGTGKCSAISLTTGSPSPVPPESFAVPNRSDKTARRDGEDGPARSYGPYRERGTGSWDLFPYSEKLRDADQHHASVDSEVWLGCAGVGNVLKPITRVDRCRRRQDIGEPGTDLEIEIKL